MTNAPDYSALHAIGFATGAALCALLWHMQRGADRDGGGASGFQLLWAIGVLWTFGSFLRYTLQLAGADATSVRLAGMLAWSCTVIGPIAIGRFVQARIKSSTRSGSAFLMLTAVAAVANFALLSWAGITHAFDIDASGYPEVSLYLALLLTCVALVLYRLHREEVADGSAVARPQWFGRGALLLAVIQVTAALLTSHGESSAGWRTLASHVGAHWTIPWSILIAVSVAQTHYADVILKRSLWLLVAVSLAVLASMLVLGSPEGWVMVAATLGCALLILIVPSLIRGLNVVVDQVILGRSDYAGNAQAFEASIARICDRDQLLDQVVDAVKSTLRLDARIVRGNDGGASSARIVGSLPIRTEGHPGYRLEVSGSHHARILMQEELGFLNAIVGHASRRLDAVAFDQKQQALLVREERLKRLLTEAELRALRTQVDPHFLFNTLNTIADLISSNPTQAERMTERLAECFRYALSRHSRELSTLDDELEFARHYLEIEQVRFGDRLRVELSRGDASGSEAVPSLLLQPLLENAIRHGLAPVREGGCVSVSAKRDGEYLRLQVDDDGVGLRSDFAGNAGVGLQNVTERLHARYSQAAKLVIGRCADGRGTSVTILVPLHAD